MSETTSILCHDKIVYGARKSADIVILDKELKVELTMVRGEIVCRRKEV